jgi:proteasome accessory factor A
MDSASSDPRPRDPSQGPSSQAPAPEEEGRILGLETEHAILYLPEEEHPFPDDGPRGEPPFELLQRVLEECLLDGRKAAVSGGLKGGYFLENGGLVHLEIYFRDQEDTPILEASTPECRSPWDLLVYSRAYDEILEETSRRSALLLAHQGHQGRIAFGKNNLDVHGTGFGCHENYLVRLEPRRSHKALFLLSLPLVLCAASPALALLLLIVAIVVPVWSLAHLVACLVRPLNQRFLALKERALAAWRRFRRWNPLGIIEHLRAAYWVSINTILFPAVAAYSLVLRLLSLRPALQDLASFLVSRQILTGAGALDFREGVYELSQRAGLTRSLAEIVLLRRRKTFYDLKGFLYSPREFFRARKRLTIVVGDSNLADVPNILKLGATTLLLEMIEAGESFADLRLRQPVKALRQVSREGPWKEIPLRSGSAVTALSLQREFLRRAKRFHEGLPDGKIRRGEILRLWEETLERLAERPHSLQDTLDWAAKKAILDQAVRQTSNWKAFFEWGLVFHFAGLEASHAAESFGDLLRRTPFHRRLRVRLAAARSGLDPSGFRTHRELYFQARKIDLRYHELGGGTGYERTLESGGMIRRLAAPGEVERATREPPPDTRARVRSYYIRTSQAAHSLRVNWNEIELVALEQHIPLPDPFYFRLPTD